MSQQDGRKLNINAGGREAGKLAILIHRIYLVMWERLGVHAVRRKNSGPTPVCRAI